MLNSIAVFGRTDEMKRERSLSSSFHIVRAEMSTKSTEFYNKHSQLFKGFILFFALNVFA